MEKNNFVKSHGLGNEYLVLDSDTITFNLSEKAIKRICNVNFGIGSDGILLKVKSDKADIGLRIYNPDGSEAEKSGNGLRIFCKYVYDYGLIDKNEFTVETKGGIVKACIKEIKNNKATLIDVNMGNAIFNSSEIPTNFEKETVENELIKIEDKEYIINCVSVGNPHCVILKENLDIEEIKKYGTYIENYKMFPNRINVQFAKIINRKEVEILIWERGAGFTLASGSSSCAVASVLRKKDLIDREVTIKMLGGTLKIDINDQMEIRMTGEVRQICKGVLSEELIEDLEN
ncbi:diaminopimelate epimerase [Flavobacterium sp.]|uniref:diaminopimelate epimerase n=1 Tax=Flavobacterium sp. TaxID=239 RepID=UPI002D08ADCD|nr:diaminopimelate epimerase [Flavobacterium sp.]HSD08661.1 diaminopimelate epimerase [Flavobacterium sp.]